MTSCHRPRGTAVLELRPRSPRSARNPSPDAEKLLSLYLGSGKDPPCGSGPSRARPAVAPRGQGPAGEAPACGRRAPPECSVTSGKQTYGAPIINTAHLEAVNGFLQVRNAPRPRRAAENLRSMTTKELSTAVRHLPADTRPRPDVRVRELYRTRKERRTAVLPELLRKPKERMGRSSRHVQGRERGTPTLRPGHAAQREGRGAPPPTDTMGGIRRPERRAACRL